MRMEPFAVYGRFHYFDTLAAANAFADGRPVKETTPGRIWRVTV